MYTFQFAFHDRVSPTPIPTEQFLGGLTEKEFLFSKYTRGCIFGLDNLMRYSSYRLMGWAYHFDMPKFLVNQHGQWQEYYAPNKTALRAALYGRVDKIIKLED